MLVVSAFLAYSELESAGEMFFMLPMIDASIEMCIRDRYAPELGEAVEADDAILGLISSTMEAFRQGRPQQNSSLYSSLIYLINFDEIT